MSAPSALPLPAARVEAVAEALYALLPAHVRLRDRASGGALRALVGVLALPSAEIDAETDAFYDALFVETAGPAALDAIAALVAATPLRPMPPGAAIDQRAYVANTVRYRRGKGTARVLEALAADVTGLGAVAVEYFQRLARLNHLLDVRPDRPGTALLADGDTAARAGGAFDLLPRLLDVRPVTRTRRDRPAGRHGITAVGVHVVRPVVPTFPAPPAAPGTAVPTSSLAGVPVARPWPAGGVETPGYYQLAAQPGAPLRLFGPDRRADAGGGRLRERDLGDRLRRLPLHQETDELRRAFLEGRPPRLPDRPWFDEAGAPFTVFLRRSGDSTFTRVPPAQVRIANLENPPVPPGARPGATRTYSWFEPGPADAVAKTGDHPVACAVDPVTGRIVVAEPAPGANDVAEVRVAYGTGLGRAVGAGAADRGDPGQPFEIRDGGGAVDLVWVVDATQPAGGSAETASRTVPTLAEALAEAAAAGAGRRSFVVLARCDIEGAPAGATIDVTLPTGSEIHVVAAQWRPPLPVPGADPDAALRGFVIRRGRRYTIDAPVRVLRGTGPAAAPAGRLVLDGLELTQGLRLAVRSVEAVDLRYVTLRAPGAIALRATGTLTAVRLTIDSSLCGPVRLGTAGPVTGRIDVCDSVLGTDGATGEALTAPELATTLCNTTVLGPSSLRELTATNVIFGAPVTVTRRQSGCVRYSFVPDGPNGSAVPRTFRCQPALALAEAARIKGAPLTADEQTAARLSVQPVFADVAADEPTYAMLHQLCPDAIRSGGEEDVEMGAFARAASGIAVANLVALFDDYLPIALEAGVIDDTRSAAVTARRNVP